LDYFPDALAAVAQISYQGNQKHNPGEPLHWALRYVQVGPSVEQMETLPSL
jgi:hypothetical protein